MNPYTWVKPYNLYFSIPRWLKLATFAYFLFFTGFGNLYQLYVEPDKSFLVIALVLIRILSGFLVILPILLFRRVGVFHLLVFPFYLNLLKNLAQNPLFLIAPFLGGGVTLQSTALVPLDKLNLIQLNLEGAAYSIIFLIFMYFGYFSSIIRPPKLVTAARRKMIPNWRFYFLSFVILGTAMAFFSIQGGLTSWISKWGAEGGRSEAMEGLGPVLRFLRTAFFLPLAWYLYKGSKVFFNPGFWVILFVTVFLGFAATGSRSSVLHSLIPFLIAYALRNRKLPIMRAFALGVVFFLLFGLLGQIRTASTFNEGNFSWENIDFSIGENFDRAVNEAEKWGNEGAAIALYLSVPEEVDFLYGLTYIGAASFWIPRAIWRNKPHGAGYYNGRLIFGRNSGVPPGAISEAFWNFGIIGIMVMGFFQGFLIKSFTLLFEQNYSSVGVIVIYLIVLKAGLTVSSLALTGLFQSLIFVILGLRFLRLL
ncbi:MAG: O-antigen polymerase [Bacteroidota bacterium]